VWLEALWPELGPHSGVHLHGGCKAELKIGTCPLHNITDNLSQSIAFGALHPICSPS
jgi:hypothetical protein